MSQGFERVHSPNRGLATAAFCCGLVGLLAAFVALAFFLMALFEPQEAARIPQEQMARSALAMLLNIMMVSCGVLAVVFGAVASSRAKKGGAKPFARGRIGLYLGVLALAIFAFLLIFNFVQIFISMDEISKEFRDRRFALSLRLPVLSL
jgi:uncharacterized membrane protein